MTPKLNIVADENIPNLHEYFDRFGTVTALPGRSINADDVKNADVLLVRSVTPVNAKLLANSPVKFVGTCTIGTDHLDETFLQQQGIHWSAAPGCNAGGVVQYVLSALAAIDDNAFNKSIGVIGSGNVGGRVCKALLGLGVSTVAYDPFLSREQNPVLTDLNSVLSSDIICMHTPYTTGGTHPTHHLINAATLQQLKPGALLVNAGRGGAIDNQALLEHLKSGADLTAVLDVWENEPNINAELMALVAFATPHIAGYSFEGRINGSTMIFEALSRWLNMAEQDIKTATNAVQADTFGEPVILEAHDLQQAILATYPIQQDDLRTRKALTEAAPGSLGQTFDLLRKTYPQRREFNHYRVHTSNNALADALSAIGFLTA